VSSARHDGSRIASSEEPAAPSAEVFPAGFSSATRFHRKIDSTAETALKAAKQIDRFPFPRFLLSLAILDEKAPSRYSRHPRRPIA
jgi:hypothetical protein